MIKVVLFDKESKPILEIIDLCKSFEAVCAIDHLSLSVQPGEIVGILGPGGAGKTILFELLSGKAAPTSGIIKVTGRDVWRKSKRALWLVGAVPTSQRDLNIAGEDSTAREHLQFHTELLGVLSLKYPQPLVRSCTILPWWWWMNPQQESPSTIARSSGISSAPYERQARPWFSQPLHGRRHLRCVIEWHSSHTGGDLPKTPHVSDVVVYGPGEMEQPGAAPWFDEQRKEDSSWNTRMRLVLCANELA